MKSLLRGMYKVRDGVKYFWASALLDGWVNWMRQGRFGLFRISPSQQSAAMCVTFAMHVCTYEAFEQTNNYHTLHIVEQNP